MQFLTAFLDTSVILSGLASPTGGSSALFQASKHKQILLLTTPYVLEEAVSHLDKLSLEPSSLKALMESSIITLVSNPTEQMMKKCTPLTADPDDIHVIAGAVASGADVLFSLDKKHIVTQKVRRSLKPMRVFTPKQFWRWVRRNAKHT